METLPLFLTVVMASVHPSRWVDDARKLHLSEIFRTKGPRDCSPRHKRIPGSAPDTAAVAEHQLKIMKLLRGCRNNAQPSKPLTLKPLSKTYDSNRPLLIQRPLLIFSKKYVDDAIQTLWKNKARKYMNAGSVAAGALGMLVPGSVGPLVTALLAPAVFDLVSEAERKEDEAKAN